MKKILISLAIIAFVAVAGWGATSALFSDTESNTQNVITTGTINIAIDDNEEWTGSYTLADIKPCQTDYINFVVNNTGSNPVDVWKKLDEFVNSDTAELEGPNEPECLDSSGTWDPVEGVCNNYVEKSDLQNYINYDLAVKVYRVNDTEPYWYQTLYVDADNKSLMDVYGDAENGVYLGMIPAGGWMEVTQSYHLRGDVKNWAQDDSLTFDITVTGNQLSGSVVLENKQPSGPWKLLFDDNYTGVLSYNNKGPEFAYEFNGVVPLADTTYVLAVGYDGGTNVDTYIGEGTSDASGNITFSGSVELGGDMKDVKAWLLPKTNWNGGSISWNQMDKWLWETGLIWYEDTDF